MYGLSRRAPYPWDAYLQHPSVGKVRLILASDAEGTKLLRRQTTGLEGVTPTDFTYAAGSPFARRTARFSRLVMGMGQSVQESEQSQRYDYALGMDWSTGLGFLAAEFATPWQLGNGPIRDITEIFSGSTTYLAVLSGERVYVSSAANIDNVADFTLSKDFSTALATPSAPTVVASVLPTPSTPTVSNVGTPDIATYTYKIVAIGATNPPRSAPSTAGTTTTGSLVLDGTNYNTVSWTAVAGATQYEIWRTAVSGGGSPATLGLIGTTALLTFDDTGLAPTTSGQPPATALSGSTTYTYKVSATGNGGIPTSAASAATTITNGPAALSSTLYNRITWSAVAGATRYRVWVTAGGTPVPALVADVGSGTLTYDDNGTPWVAGTPPSAPVVQSPRGFAVSSQWAGHQRLFVSMESGNFWGWDPSSGWAQADVPATAIWAERGLFWRYDGQLLAYYTDRDPLAATLWTSLLANDNTYPATRLIPLGGQVLLLDQRRITYATQDLTPDLTVPSSADNGRTAIRWLGALYVPFGTAWYRAILSDGSISLESIGVERLVENTSPIRGRVTGQAAWNTWHQFFALYDEVTGVSYLMKFGAWVSPEQAGNPNAQLTPVIHGALESWTKKVTWMLVSAVGEPSGNPRLYVGFGDGYMTSCILPRSSPYAPGDPACRFRSSGYTILPRHHMGFQADLKGYQDVTAFGPVLDVNRYLLAFYSLEDGAEHGLVGSIANNGDLLVFTHDAEGDEDPGRVVGRWIRLRMELHTTANTSTPVLEGLALHEQLKPAYVEQIAATARIGPRLNNRRGDPCRISGDQLLLQLRDLAALGDGVTLTLPDGSTHTVAVVAFADRLLPGNAQAAEQHAVSFTLAKFHTVTPSTA